ncbi:hypothetical protein VTO73DRAFT_201 [Trametes versicolor]
MLRPPIVSHRTRVPLMLYLFALGAPSVISAISVNRTIDDEKGDSVTGALPVYGPSTGTGANWFQGTLCVHCTMLPNKVVDISQTFDGTWHDSTYHPGDPDHTLDAQFTGTAIYVYFIVPNFVAYTTTLVNLSFSIDGTFYNQYEHIPDNSTSVIGYQTLVFHTTNLVNMDHNIQVRAGGDNASLLLFDNMIYTVEEADPPSPISSTVTTSLISSTVTTQLSQTSQTTTTTPSTSSASPADISSSITDASSSPSAITATSDGSSSGSHAQSGSPHTQPGAESISTSPPFSPSGSPSSQSQGAASLSIGAIAGAVAGGVIIIALLLLVLFCYLRRRRQHSPPRAHVKHWVKKIRETVPVRAYPQANDRSTCDAADVPRRSSTPPEAVDSNALQRGSSARSAQPYASLLSGPPVADEKTEEDVVAHADAVPPSSSSAYASSSYTGVSTLRAQVAVLRGELERIRHVEEEMHQFFTEPPPRYEDL